MVTVGGQRPTQAPVPHLTLTPPRPLILYLIRAREATILGVYCKRPVLTRFYVVKVLGVK